LSLKMKTEPNNFIQKVQKEDIEAKLIRIFGKRFAQYRKDFHLTEKFYSIGWLPDFPVTVNIEPTPNCNLACFMCYAKHHNSGRKEMPLDLLQKIMQECKRERLYSLGVCMGGEVTTYSNLMVYLRMIVKARIMDVFFDTNGVEIKDEALDFIVRHRFSRALFSVDAATRETYQAVRWFDRLDKVEANINRLIELKARHHSELPIIRLSFVVNERNVHEKEAFVRKWQDKVDYIDFQRKFDFSWIGGQKKERNPYPAEKLNKNNVFCSYPFYSLNVWATGEVTPCCTFPAIYAPEMIVGNVRYESIRKIWHGKKFQAIRDSIFYRMLTHTCRKCMETREKNLF
jgi:radical SAM protein with 4Fe4S-binding SPASM domain